MAILSSTLAYDLADILAMSIEYDRATEKITGTAQKTISLGGLEVVVKPKIVASRVELDKVQALVRVMGNLYLLVTVSHRNRRVYVVNAAKFDGVLEEELLDRSLWQHKIIAEALGRSMVKVFEQTSLTKKTWAEMEL